ncbi:MAG: peptidoglycan DD-metalloendopeptidase family protein [Legionella sp.]|nr:peptidoglycan DD-metalloendopeptidase family protein [Legionella sp.]
MKIKSLLCSLLVLLLFGCAERRDLAPVSELSSWSFSRFNKTHRVRPKETLYAIAFHYDADYRQLAHINHLRPPYSLRIGQVLTLQGLVKKHRFLRRQPQKQVYLKPVQQLKPKLIYSTPIHKYSTGWFWPVKGHVSTSFFPNQGKKGIDIASKKGEKVVASSGGVVAYSGSGLSGYGNLIIIKHNHEFLTAYGNNSKNLVSEGQQVKAGQVIAETGIVDHKYWGVHFEIRRRGLPVNPLLYLQRGSR